MPSSYSIQFLSDSQSYFHRNRKIIKFTGDHLKSSINEAISTKMNKAIALLSFKKCYITVIIIKIA